MEILRALIIIAVFILPFIAMIIMVIRSPQGCETDEFGFRYCDGCDGRICPSAGEAEKATP